MRRPPTDRERLLVRILIAAHEALRPARVHRISLVDGVLRGSSRWMHDNTAGSSCYGMKPHYHTHFHTNHDRS